ncbi:3,4-dihydroxy-2-butanone-4-phosphate synthase [Thermaerobacter litoralis]
MFTGIVQGVGRCTDRRTRGGGLELWIEAPFLHGVRPGDSVAVNGVCLTVTAVQAGRLAFTAVPETLRVTTLADLQPGDEVNVEPALRWGDPVGGHVVLGHVDGTGRVVAVVPQDGALSVEIEAPDHLIPFLAPKGSIAVDGVSLTVVAVNGKRFSVALVPHTLERTALGRRRPGDRVNLEADWLARYGAGWLAPGPGRSLAAAPAAAKGRPGRAGEAQPRDAGLLDPVRRVEAALDALRQGEMVVILDDEDREGEGDLVVAAQHATPAHVNFMLSFGRGLICAAMAESRCRALGLPLMVDPPADPMGTPFTISVDAREGVTTGISAADRARTLRTLADPASRPGDLVRPGHVFPLRARPWGVLQRRGHTEAAVDLMRLAGLEPVAAICEILTPDGRSARPPAIVAWATQTGLPWVRVSDIVTYRLRREDLVRPVASTRLPTRYGEFRLTAFEYQPTGTVHLALVYGAGTAGAGGGASGRVGGDGVLAGTSPRPAGETKHPPAPGDAPLLVRVHSQCLTGDAFGSLRCDCGDQLQAALRAIAGEGRGALIYLQQEGRGIGLAGKIRAYALQDQGLDTVDANLALGLPVDSRDYGVAAQMLRALGAHRIRLMTNNPDKVAQLQRYGIQVTDRLPLEPAHHPENRRYLLAKRRRLGHWLTLAGTDAGVDDPSPQPTAPAAPPAPTGPGGRLPAKDTDHQEAE